MDERNDNTDKLAIAALVCGLTSIFLFPLAFGSAGIIFGLIVQDRAESDTRAYQNARLGVIFGIIGLVFWVVTLFSMNYLGFDANSLLGTQQAPSAF